MKWLFGKSGILRAVAPEWRDFMRADFHPWDANNRELIDQWKRRGQPPRDLSRSQEATPHRVMIRR